MTNEEIVEFIDFVEKNNKSGVFRIDLKCENYSYCNINNVEFDIEFLNKFTKKYQIKKLIIDIKEYSSSKIKKLISKIKKYYPIQFSEIDNNGRYIIIKYSININNFEIEINFRFEFDDFLFNDKTLRNKIENHIYETFDFMPKTS